MFEASPQGVHKWPASDAFPRPLAVWVDVARLDANLAAMQTLCDKAGVELWPHIKTHKSLQIARRQLELGARGLTCAKLGEAEVMAQSGVRRIFWAHSLSTQDTLQRARALRERLEDLIIAVTSLEHARYLLELIKAEEQPWSVAIAVNTGLGREGLRSLEQAAQLRALLERQQVLKPVAIYTHEGHAYGAARADMDALVDSAHAQLLAYRKALGGGLPLWPGCSVTAALMAGKESVSVVRPGAYLFGDLYLTDQTGAMPRDGVALFVRATVVDKPEPGLALIDAGTKTFGSDRLPDGVYARCADAARDLTVTRLSEEHGFVTGGGAEALRIGDVIDWIPAHVCPVVNLTDRLFAYFGDGRVESWPVDARGRND